MKPSPSSSPSVIQTASDADLVDAVRAGDERATTTLVTRHAPTVYAVALRICGDREDADDAAQLAMVKAWRSLEQFDGMSAFSTWLYRITTNTAIDVVRRRRRTRVVDEAVPDVASTASDPARRVVDRDRLRVLAGAVRDLPDDQRLCLVLREVAGASYPEIADELATTLPSVKSLIFRARQAIGTALATFDREG